VPVSCDLDLDLEHILDAGSSEDHPVLAWWRSSYPPARRSDFREITKVSLSRDLWPRPWPWAHPGCRPVSGDYGMQVWSRSSHLSGRRSDLRKMFTDRQTDWQTDRRTDRQTDGRRTPHDCISSRNELKIKTLKHLKHILKHCMINQKTTF